MSDSTNLVSLARCKALLSVSGTSEDVLWRGLLTAATRRIEMYCHRNLIAHDIIEYTEGSSEGSSRLFLSEYPVNSITDIREDTDKVFGTDTITSSDDYDYDPITGIVTKESSTWQHVTYPTFWVAGTRTIQVTYNAGYKLIEIKQGVNDKIDIEETAETELTGTVTPGWYSPLGLCEALKTALGAATGSGEAAAASTYTVYWDAYAQKFTLISDGSGGGNLFKILWATGTNTATSVGSTLGFTVTADDTGALRYVADSALTGYYLPADLETACAVLASWYREQRETPGATDLSAAELSQTSTWYEGLPAEVAAILDRYRKRRV